MTVSSLPVDHADLEELGEEQLNRLDPQAGDALQQVVGQPRAQGDDDDDDDDDTSVGGDDDDDDTSVGGGGGDDDDDDDDDDD
jgi:hypothetical protein